MKNIKVLLRILLMTLVSVSVYGQNVELSDLQNQTKQVIQKVYPACVRIWGFDTIRNVQNSSQFSGVVVSADGHILTVSHAIVPSRTYKVRFPDGRETLAIASGKIGLPAQQTRPDLGMLKIVAKGNWPVVEMGWSYSLKANQPCISISYPETLNQLVPTVRFGIVKNVLNEFGFVESTCKMEPGDSGGPLFDIKGRVIGLHSRCRESEGENFEVPVDAYRKYWKALLVAEDYKELPADVDSVAQDPHADKVNAFPVFTNLMKKLSDQLPYPANAVVAISSMLHGSESKSIGTVIVVGNIHYLIGKSSLVSDKASISYNGTVLPLSLLKRDEENDLVLFKLQGKIKGGVPIDMNKPMAEVLATGNFLISQLPSGARFSIAGSGILNQPRKFSAGFLGAPARFVEGKVQLINPMPGSPALLAGLRSGDRLQSVNGTPINQPMDYGNVMIQYNPLDTVTVEGNRGEELFKIKVVLALRPVGTHVADKFYGGKSIRLDGFKKVIAHDPILTPTECGGPVFNVKGEFIGINIARFSRTATLLMPVSVINAFIKNALTTK